MSSFTQLAYHIVYATKYRRPTIRARLRERLYEYTGGTIRAKHGCLIEIGGIEDHVHILARLSPALSVSEVIRDIKANTSRWMNDQSEVDHSFEWQKGYSAFTVSYSQLEKVQAYIQNQQGHHHEKSFEEEYMELLSRHGIAFRREYLFEDEHHG
ncbi:MAG: IS200/IS605 family transposase [Pirellulales bacterium]